MIEGAFIAEAGEIVATIASKAEAAAAAATGSERLMALAVASENGTTFHHRIGDFNQIIKRAFLISVIF
jgi:hypothetical protein